MTNATTQIGKLLWHNARIVLIDTVANSPADSGSVTLEIPYRIDDQVLLLQLSSEKIEKAIHCAIDQLLRNKNLPSNTLVNNGLEFCNSTGYATVRYQINGLSHEQISIYKRWGTTQANNIQRRSGNLPFWFETVKSV